MWLRCDRLRCSPSSVSSSWIDRHPRWPLGGAGRARPPGCTAGRRGHPARLPRAVSGRGGPVRARLAGPRRGRQGRDEPRPEPQRLRPELRRRPRPDAVPRADVRPRREARRTLPIPTSATRPTRSRPPRRTSSPTARRPTGSAPSSATTRPTGTRRSSWAGPSATATAPASSGRSRAAGSARASDRRRSPSSRPAASRASATTHFHDGIDIAAALGTPVRAIAAGRVTIAGRMSDGAVVVEIEHAPGVFSRYGHLEPDLRVRVGQSVSAGDPSARSA